MRACNFIFDGGAEGIRTPDLLRAREALSQLSYSPAVRTNYTSKRGRLTSFLLAGVTYSSTLVPETSGETLMLLTVWKPLGLILHSDQEARESRP